MSATLLLALLTVVITNDASVKTGIGIAPQFTNINCNDLNTITSPSWWYNWDIESTFERSNCTPHRTIEYVPMVWGWWNQNLSAVSISPDVTTIMGFCEPNRKVQSNLHPATAVQGWKEIQTVFHDKLLVSPATSPCSGSACIAKYGSQEAWFDEFFRICDGTCRIDYMAVHFYWCYALDGQTVNDWMASLNHLYTKYGYPLWLTEFNCYDGTVAQQQAFMDEVIPLLDATDWIAKYAWFVARNYVYNTEWQLFTQNISQSKLTNLGQNYNKYSLSPTQPPSDLSPTNASSTHPMTSRSPTQYPTIPPSAASFRPSNYPTTKYPSIPPIAITLQANTSYIVSIAMNECGSDDSCEVTQHKLNTLVLHALGDDVNIMSTDITDNAAVIRLSVVASNSQLSADYIGKRIEKEVEKEYGDVVCVVVKAEKPISNQTDDDRLLSNRMVMIIVIAFSVIVLCCCVCCIAAILYCVIHQKFVNIMTQMQGINDRIISDTNTNTNVADKDRSSDIASMHDLPSLPVETVKDEEIENTNDDSQSDGLWVVFDNNDAHATPHESENQNTGEGTVNTTEVIIGVRTTGEKRKGESSSDSGDSADIYDEVSPKQDSDPSLPNNNTRRTKYATMP